MVPPAIGDWRGGGAAADAAGARRVSTMSPNSKSTPVRVHHFQHTAGAEPRVAGAPAAAAPPSFAAADDDDEFSESDSADWSDSGSEASNSGDEDFDMSDGEKAYQGAEGLGRFLPPPPPQLAAAAGGRDRLPTVCRVRLLPSAT